jgi:hypothetical protein
VSAAAAGVTALFAPIGWVARADNGQCTLGAMSQPFLPWGDPASYELVFGGDFENAAWTLRGDATRVPGSEPYAVTGELGNWSLSLPAGSAAQSRSACVATTEPTIRFFVAGSGTVRVTVTYGDTVIVSGTVVAAGNWMPTPALITGSPITATLTDNNNVTINLTGISGDPQIDDVFIDPWNRG